MIAVVERHHLRTPMDEWMDEWMDSFVHPQEDVPLTHNLLMIASSLVPRTASSLLSAPADAEDGEDDISVVEVNR